MNKKVKYPEAVYKDRVYRWFIDNTSTLCDADLQKFVNSAMYGKLTFQCADEIDLDDPDISMIDHLLMDIASEKNNELINSYTDEIDWDSDYVEKYNVEVNNMDKKLEARIARLEKLVYRKIKNENMELDNLAAHIDSLLNQYQRSTHDLSAYEVKAYSNDVEVMFYWDYDYGDFTITPNEDGGYEVEDGYYVEKFDTIQQVVDYLIQKDDDNGR